VNNLAELTVVIPTFERQEFLERQVQFWKKTEARVEILDGSLKRWGHDAQLVGIKNISYWHLPVTIEQRLLHVIDRIQTRYSVLLSDDEFFVVSALQNCLEELNTNSDIVACKGLAIGFAVTNRGIDWSVTYPTMKDYAIDQGDPRSRMMYHMKRYEMATLWAVMRADVFKRTLRAMAAGPFRSAAAGEIQTSLITAWSGKCKVTNEVMWLRSYENENIWWKSGKTPFHEWYVDPANLDEVQSFLRTIVESLEGAGAEDAEVYGAVTVALEAYVDSCSTHGTKRLRTALLRLLPNSLRKSILDLKKRLKGQNKPRALSTIVEEFRLSGVTVDHSQLTSIAGIVEQFHMNRKKIST
jgi:glycosyltransferase domain-containing protein